MSPSRYFVAGFVTILVILVLIAFAGLAFAQVPCAPVEKVEAALVKNGAKVTADLKLRTDTGEIPMRIFVHPKTGAWFLITYPASGVACWVLVGEGFELARLPVVPS